MFDVESTLNKRIKFFIFLVNYFLRTNLAALQNCKSYRKINMLSEELLRIHPQKLQFPFELNKEISCVMLLTNNTENFIAYKVGVANVDKYIVKPNTGVVRPHSTVALLVTIQAQNEAHADMQCKDEFRVQCAITNPETTIEDITSDMFKKESGNVVQEQRLEIQYVSPSQDNNSEPSSATLSKDKHLMKASDSSVAPKDDSNQLLQQEDDEMPVPHSNIADNHQSMKVVAQAEPSNNNNTANNINNPENQAAKDPQSSRFTWKIENFTRLKVKKYYSDMFVVGGFKWRLLIFPKGNNVDYLSLYLDVADAANLPYGWSRYAQFSLAVVNQIHNKNSVRKDTQHQFNARESDWGFTSFMRLKELHARKRGYLVNDTVVVEVEFVVV